MTGRTVSRRQRKRIPLRYGIDAPSKIAFTDDISPEGMFIRTALAIRPGTRLIVALTPPEGTIVVHTEVRWAKKVPAEMLHKLKGGVGLRILSFAEGESLYRELCQKWGL